MSIRKIKAHGAIEDGDYIRIERRSTWIYWLLFGVLVGSLAGYFVLSLGFAPQADELIVIVISALFFATIGLLIGNEEEVRRVPKADLVEIKRYASGHVTVVLDDERVKRQSRGRG